MADPDNAALARRLEDLAGQVEAAIGSGKELDRMVARSIGWHRVEPRHSTMSRGAWIAPEDFCGVMGSGAPILDSLHGTTMHRDPPPFTASLDAALSLFPTKPETISTNPRKATAAALRARAALAMAASEKES
jgi:hypothetical protein